MNPLKEEAYQELKEKAEEIFEHACDKESMRDLSKAIEKIDQLELDEEDAPIDFLGQLFDEVRQERAKQDKMWGIETDDKRTNEEFVAILVSEMHPIPWGGYYDARAGFLKVAAVALAAIESLDRINLDTD